MQRRCGLKDFKIPLLGCLCLQKIDCGYNLDPLLDQGIVGITRCVVLKDKDEIELLDFINLIHLVMFISGLKQFVSLV